MSQTRAGNKPGGKDSALYARLPDMSMLSKYPLPSDIMGDLQDAFFYYDPQETGFISMAHFRNILHNFGFHNKTKKEIDDEIRRADPDIAKRQFVDFPVV